MPRGRPRKNASRGTRCPSSSDIFRTLISAVKSPEGLNPATLKRLYHALLVLSKKSSVSGSPCAQGVRDLADILFRNLEVRFQGLLSDLVDVTPEDGPRACFRPMVDELCLLLRCCMAVFVMLGDDQSVLVAKGRVLLSVLRVLLSMELRGGNGNSATFKKLMCCESAVDEESVALESLLEISGPWYSYLLPIFEAFADELLMGEKAREYLMLIDSASSRSEMVFSRHCCHDNTGSVLEVITSQFILSVSLQKASENLFNRLFWHHGMDSAVPEMSLQAALSLLLNPITISAPKIYQSYLISLVSESIGIRLPSGNVMPDLKLVDYYSLAFKTSVNLYSRHMSSLLVKLHDTAVEDSFLKPCLLGSSFQLCFESFLQPATNDKLSRLISESDESWKLYLGDLSFRTNSDLVAASVEYVKENLCVFDDLYKNDILSIITCIIVRGSSDAITDAMLFDKVKISLQDIILLASIVKLMGSSILQTLRCIRHLKLSSSLNSLGDVSSYKGCMVDFDSCFEQLCMHLPIKRFVSDITEPTPERHKESKQMLLHFSSLLSLSYAGRLDFLVKNCLLIVMALLNMFIIEEGDLSVLGPLFNSKLEHFSSRSSEKIETVSVQQGASSTVTLKTQKIQEMYMRTHSLISLDKEDHDILIEREDFTATVQDGEETCRGDAFLQHILGKRAKKLPDFDDLADFIECKKGKDYSAWLKGRERFRGWKRKKRETHRWNEKKRAWNSIRQIGHRTCYKIVQKAKGGL